MSATISSLTADIITVTKRPDLSADISLHLKNALIKAHSADFWLQDLSEGTFDLTPAAPTYSIDYKTAITRFRTLKYLRTIDPITREITRILKPIPIEKIVDGYGYLTDYSYYLAGSNLQVRVSDSSTAFGYGAYLYPDTTLTTPSWIADNFPFAIIYEAARTLYRTIGKPEESSAMEGLVAEAMAEVRMVGITTVGE